MNPASAHEANVTGTTRSAFGRLLLGVWAAAILLVGAFLMAGHLVALPLPRAADERLPATLPGGPQLAAGKWVAVHILYESCGCSKRVLTHLLARGARADLRETVAFVREPGAGASIAETRTAIEHAGFGFEALSPDALVARYHVESAPSLLVADGGGTVRYLGGYNRRSGSLAFEDLTIIDRLRAGGSAAPLPVFGCAVSSRLQGAIDPLGIKYRRGR
ncbi:MAG TPA: hypothetical protein VHO06_07160 [Polyangia bacterium]|nr:hypothetical protein [Polyangia bacterium]